MSETKPAGLVVEFLRERDVACPTCLYNLRETAGDRCPECGTAIRLEVAGSTSGAFWWLASVIGCAVGGLVLTSALVHLLTDVYRLLDDPSRIERVLNGMMSVTELPRWSTITGISALVAATGVLFAWLLTSRRRFGRLPRASRVAIGLFFAAAPLTALALLRLVILLT